MEDIMYYVGIDVSKEKHYVCILDESSEIACKPFSRKLCFATAIR